MDFKTETQLRQELADAWALVDAYKKDAMRYQWLREHSTQPVESWSTHSEPASLDEAVDEAMRSNAKVCRAHD